MPPLANLGYRKPSMNVKIAMLVAASEYERLTFDVASSSPMECLLGRVLSRSSSLGSHGASTARCPCRLAVHWTRASPSAFDARLAVDRERRSGAGRHRRAGSGAARPVAGD